MSSLQTDNSYFDIKVELRLSSLDLIDRDEIYVLDCFSGNGLIWNEVELNTKKQLNILKIDKKNDRNGIYLIGDNEKFIKNIDLSKYDIIDLDAYGSPFKLLDFIFEREFSSIIHCTFIQSMYGKLDKKLLNKIGYPDSMINKCPSIFDKNGLNKMLMYLNKQGVKEITGYFLGRKNYFYFLLN